MGGGEDTPFKAWDTPVLNVTLSLPTSEWGRRTVMYSYKDFNKSMSEILYASRMTHNEA